MTIHFMTIVQYPFANYFSMFVFVRFEQPLENGDPFCVRQLHGKTIVRRKASGATSKRIQVHD